MQDLKTGILMVLTQISSGSFGLLDYNDHLTFIARLFSIITASLFVCINWRKIKKLF